jgi:hypothetical protein
VRFQFVIALLIGAVMLLASVVAPILQPEGTQSIIYQFMVPMWTQLPPPTPVLLS